MGIDKIVTIRKLKEYFTVQEFVDPIVYDTFREGSWKFIDSKLLHAMFILRERLNSPITINDWHRHKGGFTQRGLRTNMSNITVDKTRRGRVYLSQHLFGKAVDFDVRGMSATGVRDWIFLNSNLFPFKMRMERKKRSTGKDINWVHLDVMDDPKNVKIHFFDV